MLSKIIIWKCNLILYLRVCLHNMHKFRILKLGQYIISYFYNQEQTPTIYI